MRARKPGGYVIRRYFEQRLSHSSAFFTHFSLAFVESHRFFISVVVVTTALHDEDNNRHYKRGFTCGSFTGVSLHPPIVSFTMNKPR